MTRNKTLLVLGMAVATMAGCSGKAETSAAPQAVASQVSAPARAADAAAISTAQPGTSGVLKASIAMQSAVAMHAQASIPALACGAETQAKLDASKAEVRKLAHAEGIDDATFDQVYAAAERKGRTRWESAPAAKRVEACEEWKAMTAETQAWVDSQGQ